ncbi:SRPBCC family protein [Spongiibacter sp.]|uniref:SRPBCC family protein n=1 Tax=Spongiibacter sp. TaxID=2024860 RepID=UPI00356B12AC
MNQERVLFEHRFTINRPIDQCFYYLGHTFENASVWMKGCRRVIAQSGYENYGMWLGKRYYRSMAGPLSIGTLTREEWVHIFEPGKRFVIRTDIPGVEPNWDYNFTALDEQRTEFHYRVYTHNHQWFSRYIVQPLFMAAARPRLNFSHPRMVELLDASSPLLSQSPA